MSLYKKDTIKIFEFTSFLLVAFLFIFLSSLANRVLVDSFALFMDERISFEGVSNILHPNGISNFIWSITDGGDHRYGRIFWNSIALFVFLPEYFFGEFGQIFSTRMFQVMILIASFAILVKTFIKNPILKLSLFFCLLNIPFSDYYMTSPKPEPIQLFFISIFLFYYRKHNMKINSFYWIFLGLAFGAKISTLPLVIIFLLPSVFHAIYQKKINLLLKKYIVGFFYFILGLVLSVPILLPPIFISIIIYKLIIKLFSVNLYYKLSLIFTLIFTNLATSLLLFFKYNIITGFALWGGSTFLNTEHGSDHTSTGFLNWLQYLLYDWFNAPTIFLAIGCTVFLILFIRYLSSNYYISFLKSNEIPILLIVAGIFSSIIIFLTVQRIWGFYLFINSILILVGIFSIIEYGLFNKKTFNKVNYYLSHTLLLIFFIIATIFWFPKNYNQFITISQRTQSNEYLENYQSYKEILHFAKKLPKDNKKIFITYDPSLFLLPENQNYEINLFWGYLVDWNKDIDVIILNKNHTPDREYVPTIDTVDYAAYLVEKEKYESVVHNNPLCTNHQKCYREALKLTNKGVILLSNQIILN